MQYLNDWRLQLAAGLLRDTTLGVAGVAYRIGYESEEAFNRASNEQWVARQPSGANAPPGLARSVSRPDVVVEAEQVCRIVGCFDLCQTRIVRSVRRF